jgi:hypothetical protein
MKEKAMMDKKDQKEQKEPKASDGIVTDEVIKSVFDQTTPESQPVTTMMIKNLEPVFFRDILKTASDMKKFGRQLGLSGPNLDRLGDIVATAYVKGFLTHRTAIARLDGKKLDEIYHMDWDAYCDHLIDVGLLRKKEAKANIQSIEPEKADNGLEGLVGNDDVDK